MRDAGEWALLEVGLTKMHPELVTLLGRLKYRTSYGQNVLNHLVESAHIGSMLASELGDRSRSRSSARAFSTTSARPSPMRWRDPMR